MDYALHIIGIFHIMSIQGELGDTIYRTLTNINERLEYSEDGAYYSRGLHCHDIAFIVRNISHN